MPKREKVGSKFVDAAELCVLIIEQDISHMQSAGLRAPESRVVERLEPMWGAEFASDMATISSLLTYGSPEIPTIIVPGIGKLPNLQRYGSSGENILDERLKSPWDELKPNFTQQVAVFLRDLTEGQKRLIANKGFSIWKPSFWIKKVLDKFVKTPSYRGADKCTPGDISPDKTGFFVELSCSGKGMAAYASPAYALTWRNFGSLTSPASGFLPPGCWIFGAKSPTDRTITYDPNAVHVPTNFTPCTQYF